MACLATIFMVSACNDDDDNAAVLPSAISNLTATPLEGGVLLEWEVPVDSNLFYVQIDYTHPVTGKRVNKNASVFCDTMLIEGMLAKMVNTHSMPHLSAQPKMWVRSWK